MRGLWSVMLVCVKTKNGVHKFMFPFIFAITHGYFHGQEFRVKVLGIPECGVAGGAILASRVLVHGTKKCRTRIVGGIECTCRQLFCSRFERRNPKSLYGYLPERAKTMNSVLQQFLVGKEEHKFFRFCGKEFQQNEDVSIRVTAKNNTDRVQPITYYAKHGLTRKATASEVH